MRISRVWAKSLYGIISLEKTIATGINLLVGINGSGKTSILSIINWLTTADIAAMSTTQFEEIGIEFEQASGPRAIFRATQNGRDLEIHGTVGNRKYKPIHVDIRVPPQDLIHNDVLKQNLISHYRQLGPEKSEVPLWNLMTTGPDPLAISLDRKIRVSQSRKAYTEGSVEHPDHSSPEPSRDPMSHVSRIARRRYSRYQSDLLKANEILKAKIIASSFTTRGKRDNAKAITAAQITAIEQKLLARMKAWASDSSESVSVTNYFNNMRALINGSKQPKSGGIKLALTNFLADDMHRISALSDALDEFESKTIVAFEPIKTYLDEINEFLEDSGKRLVFNEQNSQLYFQLAHDRASYRNIELMSSGERQIIILLTHIAFAEENTKIFVIDEPELSLHPKWQHQLLPSIDKLMRKDSQMIIATHSPEIVGNYVSSCIEV